MLALITDTSANISTEANVHFDESYIPSGPFQARFLVFHISFSSFLSGLLTLFILLFYLDTHNYFMMVA